MPAPFDAWSFTALDTLPVAVTVVDARAPDMPIVFANAAFEALTGHAAKDVIGRTCWMLQGDATEPDARDALRRAIEAGEPIEIAIHNHRKDGSVFRNRLYFAPIRDTEGTLTHYLGLQRDVTHTEQAEAAARADAERLRLLAQATHDAVWDWDLRTNRVVLNSEYFALFGFDPNEPWTLNAWIERIDPDQRDAVLRGVEAALADPTRLAYAHLYRFRGGDGNWRWVEDRSVLLRDAQGKAYRALGAIQDVTPKRHAEQALRDRAQRYRRLLDLAFEGVTVLSPTGELLYRNSRAEELLEKHHLIGGLDSLSLEDGDDASADFHRLIREPGAHLDRRVRARTKDGGHRWVELRAKNRSDDPDVRGIVVHWRDVTETLGQEAERRDARARERRLRELFEIVEDVTQTGGWEVDLGTGVIQWTPGTHRIHESSPDAFTPTLDALSGSLVSGTREVLERAFEQTTRDGTSFATDIEIMTASGRRVPARVSGRAEMRDGRAVRVFGAIQDVTVEARARAALRRQATVIDQIRDAIIVLDLEGRVLAWNDGARRLYGQPIGAVLGRRRELFEPGSTSVPAETVATALARGDQLGFEARARRGDREIDVRVALTPFLDEQGTRVGVIALVSDVTENKRLQAQLAASQRMEAVGLLAGGVAHDFNNLLTVVQGNADDMLDSGALPQAMRSQLLEVREAARRAASLTRQLLAFGRRQVLKPVRLELSALVGDVMQLLQRLVGEHITIGREIATTQAWVEADRSQLEQVLLNLAINARDAMAAGGVLTLGVTTLIQRDVGADVPPGEYCCIVVKDSGTGMDAPTLARIFEPFFTTKDPSRGTGLGLATVYGIVKQSGGSVTVESAPGRGSTFRVLLPRSATPDAVASVTDPPASRREEARPRETILLVEDDDAVRRVCKRVLEKQGYAILEASRPSEALAIAAARPTGIALVLTDIVMPGMSGAELVQQLRGSHPGIRYLLISGYADDMDQLRDAMQDGMTFLPKPFTPDQLTKSVREAIAKGDTAAR